MAFAIDLIAGVIAGYVEAGGYDLDTMIAEAEINIRDAVLDNFAEDDGDDGEEEQA